MAERGFEALVTRALADSDFRAMLVQDARRAVASEGYAISEDELSLLMETDLEGLAFELDERASLSMLVLWGAPA